MSAPDAAPDDPAKRAEWRAAADATERLLFETFDRVADGIVLFDRHERFRYLNQRALVLLGVADGPGLIGRRVWDVFPQRVDSAFFQAFQQVLLLREARMLEEWFPPTSRWFDVRLHPSQDDGVIVFLTDATERRRVIETLQASERDWQALAEQMPAVIYRAEDAPSFRALWVSPRLAEFGLDPKRWVADPTAWVNAVHPADAPRVMAEVPALLARHGEAEMEYRMLDGHGRWRTVRDTVRRVATGDGRRFILQGVILDLTPIRESEAALRESREALAHFAQRLLHQEKQTTHRLAQSLHDGLGQTLAVIRLHHDHLVAQTPGLAENGGRRIGDLLTQAVNQVRQVLHDLRPPLLDEQGLVAALDSEVRHLQRGPDLPVIDLRTPRNARGTRWPADVEYGAFVIAREALTNALQHARAARVQVRLSHRAGALRLQVRDDGIGLPRSMATGRSGHYGITGMHERASAIGAELTVQSSPAGGTEVRLDWRPPAAPPRAEALP